MARTSNNDGESKAPKAAGKTPARRRSDKVRQATTTTAAAANDSASAATQVLAAAGGNNGAPSPAEVQRLAYDLYVQRGCCDGHDKEDWYEAERQLRR